jgi:hypothetical protein
VSGCRYTHAPQAGRSLSKKTIMLSKNNKVLHIAIPYGIIVQENLIGGKYNGDRSKSFQ